VAGRRREALCEIELELKQGEPSCLFDLAEALATELPVRIDNTSKAERGYRLASGVRSRPVTASMTPLAADLTVDGAFGAIAAACLQQLQANERGMLAGRDPEYLHQARVALRRLRSAFRVFSRSVPREAVAAQLDALRTIARVLGEARDWDVFVGEFLSIALPARPDDAAADAVRRRAVTLRAQARRSVRAMVGSREYTLALLAMARLLFTSDWQLQRPAPYAACAQGSLRSFASQTLERSHRRLRKMALGIDRINPEQRHALRLRVKKLRYAAEFLSPLFSRKASRSYLSRLKALQEVLGGLNDDATAGRLLGALAPAPADTEAQCTLAYLRGYLAARAQGELDKLEDSLQRACDARPFW
jgi:triphosphatase